MTTDRQAMKYGAWLADPLPGDVALSIERLCRADDVRHVAVMPDVHLAHDICVGVAMATQRLIYPAAVGSDIGCGMAAIRFDVDAGLLADEHAAARVLAALYRRIPSLKQPRGGAAMTLPPRLQKLPLSSGQLEKLKARDARFQLGTLGRGNHFVELQADEQNRLWLMVHSGSRGMGQAITGHHVRQRSTAGERLKLMCFEADSPAGEAYLQDVAWAIRYAEENRLTMIAAVEQCLDDLLGATSVRESLIHSSHNHVLQETHFGQRLWVHRKGALSAMPGEPGVIPGSMGSASFHVSGRGNAAALCSSSHGAGRALSRAEAATLIPVRRLEREMQGVWFDHRAAAQLRDEAPSAYKDIHRVMRAQRELTRIDRQLRPLLSYKGV